MPTSKPGNTGATEVAHNYTSSVYDDWVVETWTNAATYRAFDKVTIVIRVNSANKTKSPAFRKLSVSQQKVEASDQLPWVKQERSFLSGFVGTERSSLLTFDGGKGDLQSISLKTPGLAHEAIISFPLNKDYPTGSPVGPLLGKWDIHINAQMNDGACVSIGPIPIEIKVY